MTRRAHQLIIAALLSYPVAAHTEQVPLRVEDPILTFVIGQHSKSGFFSIFFGAVNSIAWARKQGKIPVVYWGEDTLYSHRGGHHGEQNVWDYYFEPVSHLRYTESDEVYRKYEAPDGSSIPPAWELYGQEVYDVDFHTKAKFEWHEIIQNNIRIKPWVAEKVEKFYHEQMAGKPVIGIHLRGTDKRLEVSQVPTGAIIERARQIGASMGNRPLFLVATDEERLLDMAKKKLGADRVIAYDSVRSRNGAPIHMVGGPNRAELGEQVLIEALLLARCDYFLHTASNVATAVMLFNPRLKTTFFKYQPTRGIMIRASS